MLRLIESNLNQIIVSENKMHLVGIEPKSSTFMYHSFTNVPLLLVHSDEIFNIYSQNLRTLKILCCVWGRGDG